MQYSNIMPISLPKAAKKTVSFEALNNSSTE
jgi:hypothetical protein